MTSKFYITYWGRPISCQNIAFSSLDEHVKSVFHNMEIFSLFCRVVPTLALVQWWVIALFREMWPVNFRSYIGVGLFYTKIILLLFQALINM